MTGPYAVSASTYHMAGFSPLPALGKLLQVTKASGRHPLAKAITIDTWSKIYGTHNVALRLPTDVIAIDIDAYKGDLERLQQLEDVLGELPITWNSDSRGGSGGKILFRVPPDIKWVSNINGITIIQHTHRYVMVYPSYNRESDSIYQWYYGLGGHLLPDSIPEIEDLSELPKSWIRALTKSDSIQEFRGNPMGISNDDLDMFNPGPPCKYMQILLEACSDKLENAPTLHDTGLSVIGVLVQAAVDGHAGIEESMDKISAIFCSSSRPRDLASEWNNLLSFVLANVDQNTISEADGCNLSIFLDHQQEQMIRDDVSRLLAVGMTSGLIVRVLSRKRYR